MIANSTGSYICIAYYPCISSHSILFSAEYLWKTHSSCHFLKEAIKTVNSKILPEGIGYEVYDVMCHMKFLSLVCTVTVSVAFR